MGDEPVHILAKPLAAHLLYHALQPHHIAAVSAAMARRVWSQRDVSGVGVLRRSLLMSRATDSAGHSLACVLPALERICDSLASHVHSLSQQQALDTAQIITSGQAPVSQVKGHFANLPEVGMALGVLLYGHAWRVQLLSAISDLTHSCIGGAGKEKLLACALMFSELMPVRLAQWVGVVTVDTQSGLAESVISELGASLAAAGLEDGGSLGSLTRVRDHLTCSSLIILNSSSLMSAYEMVSHSCFAAAGGQLSSIVSGAGFGLLWGWSGTVSARLLSKLCTACGTGGRRLLPEGLRGVAQQLVLIRKLLGYLQEQVPEEGGAH